MSFEGPKFDPEMEEPQPQSQPEAEARAERETETNAAPETKAETERLFTADELKNMNYYERLGVPETASEEEIKKAFRKQSKKYHPEAGGDTESYKHIAAAGNELSSQNGVDFAEKRQKYDDKLRYERMRANAEYKSHANRASPETSNEGAKNEAAQETQENNNRTVGAFSPESFAVTSFTGGEREINVTATKIEKSERFTGGTYTPREVPKDDVKNYWIVKLMEGAQKTIGKFFSKFSKN